MGTCGETKNKSKKRSEGAKSEVFTGHKPVPVRIINKVMKFICKITIETKERK